MSARMLAGGGKYLKPVLICIRHSEGNKTHTRNPGAQHSSTSGGGGGGGY